MAKPQASSLSRSFIQIPVPSLLPYPVCISILTLRIHTNAGSSAAQSSPQTLSADTTADYLLINSHRLTSPPPPPRPPRYTAYEHTHSHHHNPFPVQVIVIGLQPLLSRNGCCQRTSLSAQETSDHAVPGVRKFPRLSKTLSNASKTQASKTRNPNGPKLLPLACSLARSHLKHLRDTGCLGVA